MATSELAAKLAAMRARMDGSEKPTSSVESRNKQVSVDGDTPTKPKVQMDETHSSAFGGGKPSAILALMKEKKGCKIVESDPTLLGNTSEVDVSSTTVNTKEKVGILSHESCSEVSTPDSIIKENESILVQDQNITPLFVSSEKASGEAELSLPIFQKPSSFEDTSDFDTLPESFIPANPTHRMKQLNKAKSMKRKDQSLKPISNLSVLDSSSETLSNSYDLEVRPLLVSNSNGYFDGKPGHRLRYASFEHDLTDSEPDDDPMIADKTRKTLPSERKFRQSHTHKSTENDIIRDLRIENQQLKDQLKSTSLLLKEKDDLIKYLVQRLEEFENIEYASAVVEKDIAHMQIPTENPMELKSALKKSSPTKNSRRFIC